VVVVVVEGGDRADEDSVGDQQDSAMAVSQLSGERLGVVGTRGEGSQALPAGKRGIEALRSVVAPVAVGRGVVLGGQAEDAVGCLPFGEDRLRYRGRDVEKVGEQACGVEGAWQRTGHDELRDPVLAVKPLSGVLDLPKAVVRQGTGGPGVYAGPTEPVSARAVPDPERPGCRKGAGLLRHGRRPR
jgi:hypothetical protein